MAPHRNIQRSDALPSAYDHPAIRVSTESLEAHFARAGSDPAPLRNPHGWAKDPIDPASLRTAAVLIAIVDEPAGPEIVLTRRTSHLRRDPGNTAFPGGGVEPDDASLEHTALRETHEEIGLAPEQIRVVGRLGDFRSQAFRIAPFVGIVEPPVELMPNPEEVASVHRVPLEHVTRSSAYQRRRMRGTPEGHWFFCMEYGDLYVGGPTVAILMGLYEALLETHPQI